MRVPTIFLAILMVLGVLLLAPSSPAQAGEAAQLRFDRELTRIDTAVQSALTRVKSALAAKSWNAWCPAHEAYIHALNRGVTDTEAAITQFLFGVMEAGGTFDDTSLTAIDDAAWMAGQFARIRVLVSAWSMLVRRGIPPERRRAALDLLDRQGVYEGESARQEGGDSESSCDPGEGASPISGRVPGTAEAAQALSKWQYAHMRAESTLQSIRTYEAEMLVTEEGSKKRETVEKRLAEVKAEYAELMSSAQEWRRKYFQAGGR